MKRKSEKRREQVKIGIVRNKKGNEDERRREKRIVVMRGVE